MKRSRSVFLAATALLVLVLAGCVRFQADLRVTPEDTVNGSIVVAVVVGDEDDSRETAASAADRIEAELLGDVRGAPGVTRTVYDEDGYLGSRFNFAGTPIDAFDGSGADGSLTLTRSDDEFEFSGVLDFTPDDEETEIDPEDDDSNITVAIGFPGAVTEHNGELSGNTVTWRSTLEAKIDMHATASAIPSGPPAWVWAVAGGAIILIALLAVYVLRKRKTA